MKKPITLFAMLLAALFLLLNTAKSQDVQQLINAIQNTKDIKVRGKLFESLAAIKPQSTADVEAWIRIAKSTNDKIAKQALLQVLLNVDENDKQLSGSYIKMLDDKDADVRIVAIVGLGKMKATEAAPRLKKIVQRFGKIQYALYLTTAAIDPQKGMNMIAEPGGAILALGEMKDETAIPLMVDKFDVLGQFAYDGLATMGKKALPTILDLARKEGADLHHYYGRWALGNIKDKEAKHDLMDLVSNDKNHEIRLWALNSLTTYLYDDEVLQWAEEMYTKEHNSLFMDVMKTKKSIPFLVNILKNDEDSDNRGYAAAILGDLRDTSAVPALEEALKNRDRNIGGNAADALQKITGKKYDWEKK